MKNFTLTFFAMLIMAFAASAQNDAISRYFQEYEIRENISSIQLSGKAFEMAAGVDVEGDEAEEIKSLLSQVTSFRMIMDDSDQSAATTAVAAHKRVAPSFEDLITVKDRNHTIYIAIDENGGMVSEVLAIIGSESKFILASIKGNMNLKDVGELTKQFSNVRKDVFQNATINPSKILVFPSPASSDSEISVQLPKELDGATVRIYSESGREIMNYVAQGSGKKINAGRLGTGVFILKARKGDAEATRKFLIEK